MQIAIVENEQRIRQAARNIRKFFDQADQTLHNGNCRKPISNLVLSMPPASSGGLDVQRPYEMDISIAR
jgi:hypothetical protein